MDLQLSAEDRALQDTIRRMAADLGPDAGGDAWWHRLRENGFLDIEVTDADGVLHAVAVAEALGEVVAPVNFAAYLTCGAVLADAKGDGAAAARWAEGRTGGFAVGYVTDPGHGLAESLGDDPEFLIMRSGDCWLILTAAQLATCQEGAWEQEPRLFEVTWDPGAGQAIPAGAPAQARDWNDLGLVLHTAELVGVMRESFDRTLAYLRQREQFGRPIGSFQALQHRAVDMLADIRACEGMAEYSAWYWAGEEADAGTRHAWIRAAVGLVAEASAAVMRECLQFHGGIAMTDEFWLHHWLRRGTRLATYQCSARWHFASVGAALKAGLTLDVPLVPP